MRNLGSLLVLTAATLGVAGCGLATDSFSLGKASADAAAPWEGPVPKATCGTTDKIETGLQGQVPIPDRETGRAVDGYNCNISLVGSLIAAESGPIDESHNRIAAWATLDSYKEDCAYYGDQARPPGGTVVVDVSDSVHPVQTEYLTTPAAGDPWESLKVNAKRGLMAMDIDGTSALDVYDLNDDCLHPELKFSGDVAPALGHEGFFTPDGNVYFMTGPNTTASASPIDLSDPSNPAVLATWGFGQGTHAGSFSDDMTRGYFCGNSLDASTIYIVDTTGLKEGRASAEPIVVNTIPLPDTFACQGTYWVTYGGKPYVIQYGEGVPPGNSCSGSDIPNFQSPHIYDISDESNPKLVATLMLEVSDPANCPMVIADTPASNRSVTFAPPAGGAVLFGYSTHHCTPDRIHDPTILACGSFLAGLRVYDIRNPYLPKELAYYNMGTISVADQTIDDAISRPVVRQSRGEVWWTTEFSGFHVGKFYESVYPFPESVACPSKPDWVFEQYNPVRC